MTRFDEVARLRVLEKSACGKDWHVHARPGWHEMPTGKRSVHDDGKRIIRDHYLDHIAVIGKHGGAEEDADFICEIRNAAPWLLGVVGCFQPGYAALLKEIVWAMDTYFQDSHYRPHKIAMGELVKAAEIMEGME